MWQLIVIFCKLVPCPFFSIKHTLLCRIHAWSFSGFCSYIACWRSTSEDAWNRKKCIPTTYRHTQRQAYTWSHLEYLVILYLYSSSTGKRSPTEPSREVMQPVIACNLQLIPWQINSSSSRNGTCLQALQRQETAQVSLSCPQSATRPWIAPLF